MSRKVEESRGKRNKVKKNEEGTEQNGCQSSQVKSSQEARRSGGKKKKSRRNGRVQSCCPILMRYLYLPTVSSSTSLPMVTYGFSRSSLGSISCHSLIFHPHSSLFTPRTPAQFYQSYGPIASTRSPGVTPLRTSSIRKTVYTRDFPVGDPYF